MTDSQGLERGAQVRVENVGGIDETAVDVTPGVTVLAGRNATNRTSLLRAIMGVLGSDGVTLKGDADEGRVTLTLDGERYTRTLTRTGDGVAAGGEPYLADPELADLFAFLLESNEARRAVARADGLRDLIMRPVDTEAIQADIEECKRERRRVESDLEDLEDLKAELPDLERERTRLDAEIESKRETLAETEAELEDLDADVDVDDPRPEQEQEQGELSARLADLREQRADLERVRSDIDLQRESIESLTAERRELEREREDLPAEGAAPEELDDDISRLRDRTERLERDVSDLQDVIQFNEELLAGGEDSVAAALADGIGSVTDDLVDETVVCWTCGTEVATERITETLDRLRSLRQEKLDTIRAIEADLTELRETRQDRRERRQRRETLERRLEELDEELDRREARLEDLRGERDRLNDAIDDLESEVARLEDEEFGAVLDLHREANRLEFELRDLETERDDVTERIDAIERRLAEEESLRAEREELEAELRDLRTRIDRIERRSVEQFNDHMDAVLDRLGYANLERIWIERITREGSEGRRTVDRTAFELHVVRSTDSGATYEDTVDHLSESEREVTGLVFALAGYLVHEVYETVPFMLLDSLEAIDAARIANLVEYVADYPTFLVVALLPEDAQALDDGYDRITDI
jgi:DNA repair exonuclease SbcCD ATPase subunit